MTEDEKEISVTAEGVTLKGGVVDDVRPVIRRAVQTADSVMRLANNLVSLPLDYMSSNLERFRLRFRDRFEEIPFDRRAEPSDRIAYAVVVNAAATADEPGIQELFANLLASACDSATSAKVHPGFPTIISQLTGLDAQVLSAIAGRRGRVVERELHISGFKPEEIAASVSNLLRLGLLDWKAIPYDVRELRKFAQRTWPTSSVRPEQSYQALVKAINEVDVLKKNLFDELHHLHQRQRLEVSGFGWRFISVALTPNAPLEDV